MANNKTQWWANQVLSCLKGTAPTIPAAGSLYVTLFVTAAPGPGTGGASGGGYANEITTANWGTNYARQLVTLGTAASGNIQTTATINFAANNGSGSVTVVGWAIVDSPTVGAGNMYYQGTFSSPQTVAVGQPFQIPAGTDFEVSEV